MEMVAKSDVDLIILREKDLSEEAYQMLAEQVLKLCSKYGKLCILHSFVNVAKNLSHPYIHLPMPVFRQLSKEEKSFFEIIGVSTHSVEEALEAQEQGASYVTSSHIFATACKEGLKPRGIPFLRSVTEAVEVPVYALGGIHPDNIEECIQAGVDGICMMSEYMIR
jgi:thiamine-phosphate pyrophosphorylase